MIAKTRPKNALKKGLKPTKMSDLPLKRPIYEISSGEEDDDGDDKADDEPSPLRTRRPRISHYTNRHSSALEELHAAAGETGLPTLKQSHTQAMNDEATLPSSSTLPHSADPDIQLSPNPSVSPHTVPATNGSCHGEGIDNEPLTTDTSAFTTTQPDITNFATATSTAPLNPELTSATNNDFVTAAPSTLHIPYDPSNPANPSLPALNPYILNHTTLRIYLTATRVYIPLKLRSCPTIHALFSAVTKILNYTDRRISLLELRLDGAEERGKGVIAVHADLEDSWECFLEEVQRWEGWQQDGVYDLGIEVCGYMVPEGQV
ncbi:MAG: hypothetical protein Q9196_006710 [Gyalolechia fulgens]